MAYWVKTLLMTPKSHTALLAWVPAALLPMNVPRETADDGPSALILPPM